MITFNGLTTDDIFCLPIDMLNREVVNGQFLVLRAGTADVLGRFWVDQDVLIVELGHIDGGGEGVLPALAVLARRYARQRGLVAVDWRVHAVTCREPNPKLRRLLDRRGFAVVDVPETGVCYHKVEPIGPPARGDVTGGDVHE